MKTGLTIGSHEYVWVSATVQASHTFIISHLTLSKALVVLEIYCKKSDHAEYITYDCSQSMVSLCIGKTFQNMADGEDHN